MDQEAVDWKIQMELESFLNYEFEFDQNFVIEHPKTAPGSHSEGVTEVMDSNKIVVDAVPDIQSKCMKKKTGKVMSKIQNDKTKEITVAPVTERKSRKRKAVQSQISEMVMDFIKSLKKLNAVLFKQVREYMDEKYGVDLKLLKNHIGKFLEKRVGNGILKEIDKSNGEKTFKIKKLENTEKVSRA